MHPLWHKALVKFIPGLSPPTDAQTHNPLDAVCPRHYFGGSSLNGKCHTKMEIKGEEERRGKGDMSEEQTKREDDSA